MKIGYLPLIILLLAASPYAGNAQVLVDTSEAQALIRLASQQLKSNELDEVILNCMDAIQLFQSVPDQQFQETARAYELMGKALVKQEEYDLAIDAFSQCVDQSLQNPNRNDTTLARCYYEQSHVHRLKQEYDLALLPLQKAVEVRRQIHGENHVLIVSLLEFMGRIYLDQCDEVAAIDCFKRALTMQEALEEDPYFFEVKLLANIGFAMHERGEVDQAILYGQKALNASYQFEKTKRLQSMLGEIYLNLAGFLKEIGDYEQAMQYLQSTKTIWDELYGPDNRSSAIVLGKMGQVYYALGEWEKAEQHYQMWLDNWEKTMPEGHIYFTDLYMGFGEFYSNIGVYDKGLEFLEKAKRMLVDAYAGDHPDVSRVYILLGNAYLADHNYTKANMHFQYAMLSNGNNPGEEQCSDPGFILDAYLGIGKMYGQRYDREQRSSYLTLALENYVRALEILKCHQESFYLESSKIQLAEKSHLIIENVLKTLHQLYQNSKDASYLAQAFAYSEQAKAFVLYETIQESKALNFSGIPADLLAQEKELRLALTQLDKQKQAYLKAGKTKTDSLVVALSSEIVDYQESYNALKQQFEQDFPNYYKLKYKAPACSSANVQQELLRPDQSLVEFFVGDSMVYVFVLNTDGLYLEEIPKDFPLEQWVSELRDGLYRYHASGNRTDDLLEAMVLQYQERATALYRKLLQPVEEMLRPSLVIVPDGVLGYVPFEALLRHLPSDPINFASYPYLFQKHAISYNYSANLLQEMLEKQHVQEPTNNWLGFAPFFESSYESVESIPFPSDILAESDSLLVAMRSAGLNQLPNSGQEMEIGTQLWEGVALLGKEATEDRFNVLASKFRMLHLSTHGVADARAGNYSYLAFAEVPDSIENELLYVRDLYNLQLNADLVVLSACETALGQLKKGEGVVSLARAFAFAGAKSIVTSLWKVDDASTAHLMEYFYRGLKEGLTKDEALRLAKQTYLREYAGMAAHPFYWAGFIGIGDAQKLQLAP